MYSYALLETGCYYLVQEKEDADVTLILVNLATDHCLFVSRFGEEEIMNWKKKTDPIFDILELLSDDAVKQWKDLFNKDAYNYEEEDDD